MKLNPLAMQTTQEIIAREIEEKPDNRIWVKIVFPALMLIELLGMLTVYFYLF